jgi:MoaA/NifB/PqqE/SkfB family radical SAM enzyme
MNNRTNDRITGIESSWKQVMKGIEILTKYGVTVDLKTPILSDNTMDFIEVHKYCVENDFQFTASSTLFPKTDGDKTPLDFVVGKKQIFDCVSKLDQIIKFKKLNLKMTDLCSLLKYSMFIDADGNVFPCNSFFLPLGI